MEIGFLILAILIIFSAFFSGSEIAFFSLSDVDLVEFEKLKKKNAQRVLKLLQNREQLLSTILVGNNIVNIAASALNTTLSIHLAPILQISEEFSVILFAGILTIILILVGEITPKSIAIIHNKGFSLFCAPFLSVFNFILFPITIIFKSISKFIKHLITGSQQKQLNISEDTVINVLNKGEELGVINDNEKRLIQNVFLFDEREVNSVMTPRTSIFAFEENLMLSETMESFLQHKFSRIPIYKDSIDNITGILYFKDVFEALLKNRQTIKIAEIAQKTEFIYETVSITIVLEKMKTTHNHMLIVVDEFGGVAGLVTMEDILEELVGEIFDEKDEIIDPICKIAATKWLSRGETDIMTINTSINLSTYIDEHYGTLQGLIMSKLEKIPSIGDQTFYLNLKFTVMKMEGNIIKLVIIEEINNQSFDINKN